jgi:hypothetical protein
VLRPKSTPLLAALATVLGWHWRSKIPDSGSDPEMERGATKTKMGNGLGKTPCEKLQNDLLFTQKAE